MLRELRCLAIVQLSDAEILAFRHGTLDSMFRSTSISFYSTVTLQGASMIYRISQNCLLVSIIFSIAGFTFGQPNSSNYGLRSAFGCEAYQFAYYNGESVPAGPGGKAEFAVRGGADLIEIRSIAISPGCSAEFVTGKKRRRTHLGSVQNSQSNISGIFSQDPIRVLCHCSE